LDLGVKLICILVLYIMGVGLNQPTEIEEFEAIELADSNLRKALEWIAEQLDALTEEYRDENGNPNILAT